MNADFPQTCKKIVGAREKGVFLGIVGETKYSPFCVDILYFSLVDSEATLGLPLSCASVQLFHALVLNGLDNLHITSLK